MAVAAAGREVVFHHESIVYLDVMSLVTSPSKMEEMRMNLCGLREDFQIKMVA